jgi:cysteate synthase
MLTTTEMVATRHYTLACPACGHQAQDDGLILECPQEHAPALLRTQYRAEKFRPRTDDDGIFRYQDLLPVIRTPRDTGRTVVYRSQALARRLGLRNLWIAFNGYWPERGARLETATFKELEAHTVLARLPRRPMVLTIPSSGNTGAAFAWACSQVQVPCLIIVPGAAMARFRFRDRLSPCVTLVVIPDGDYPDAIDLAGKVSASPPFQLEGGVKNVGRRDGLGTVLLAAYEEMQRLPDFYVQAAGSGTGSIAVHEAATRLRELAGEPATPRLLLCQNEPFTPIYDAWRSGRRTPPGRPAARYRPAIRQVVADELTNWAPPYSITGGVYDVLTESGGDVLAVRNDAVRAAGTAFLQQEGIDIEPAAAVAVAGLRAAVRDGRIVPDAAVLLNITGGGRARRDWPGGGVQAEAQLRLSRAELDSPAAAERITNQCLIALDQ